ncbi:hypothetical protein D3C78_825470 [compost metagenome]
MFFYVRCAHFQRRCRRNKAFRKLRGNALFNDKPFGRRTNLSGILVAPRYRGFHRQIQIGIIQYDKRIGTA